MKKENSVVDNLLGQMRSEAAAIFNSAVAAVNPQKAVKRFVRTDGAKLILGRSQADTVTLDLNQYERIFLMGGGKATAAMARAIEELLGNRIHSGLINVKYGFTQPLKFTRIVEAGHPLPDKNGVQGTAQILQLLESANADDLLFSLISGGGSALLVKPCSNIILAEKQELTRRLLACGAGIDEINTLRKHISAAKGGLMARTAHPATVVNLMLSDVVGDKTDVIASGPFTPNCSTYQQALDILDKYHLHNIPETIKTHLTDGFNGKIAETPKPGAAEFEKVYHYIIGSNILALEAAREQAIRLGYNTLILSSMIEGETKEVARAHSAIAKEIIKTGHPITPPACIISGGETTVTLQGQGRGGRNQEFCLAAALDITELPARVAILSGGTDGDDGPTDAAGAIVDPLTVKRGEAVNAPALRYLSNNDAYSFFKKTGDLLMTGPTGTNVMDVRLMLVR
ncbi:glycerate kinase [Desulfococcaceae bacterium HSG9]|nr:glycerate kinase [Desulfococcaceae bacterium HSG9]